MAFISTGAGTVGSYVPALIASGEFKLREDLMEGLESVGEAILAEQKGTDTGKSIIVVADQYQSVLERFC